MIEKFRGGLIDIINRHWLRILLMSVVGALVPITIVQVLYPSNTLLPLTSVDSVDLSGWNKTAASQLLDAKYSQVPINIYFGESSDSDFLSPKPSNIGVSSLNEQRINGMDYPWYLRIAPGSLFWGHLLVKPSNDPSYIRDTTTLSAYIKSNWGDSCNIQPEDASLEVTGGKVVVVSGRKGGTCNIDDIYKILSNVNLSITSKVSAIIPADLVNANVTNTKAIDLASTINNAIASGVEVVVGQDKVLITKDQLLAWIEFDISGDSIDYHFNSDKASDYLTQQLGDKVKVAAGVTTISTYDFVEKSRQVGASGQSLDISKTLENIKSYISGKVDVATVGIVTTEPTINYDRSYSETYQGLAALMSNFATTHSGTYGIALTELSGEFRRAVYNGSESFTTASTYKLFVAYSTLLRIESGEWHWSDQVQGGRDLTKCFDDMIVVSDNDCAQALLTKIGFTAITDEAHAIGSINTSFLGNDGIKSTPEDIALFLAELQTGQILKKQSDRDILINAMKRNVYRQGIPSGATGVVADKVGFLDALLHDAAIVYSTKGPYVLVIMTDGSSWSNIAELTRQLDQLVNS
jgi:beta-lactamase class A